MTLDPATLATVASTICLALTISMTLMCLMMHRPRPLVLWALAFWALTIGSNIENPDRLGVPAEWVFLPANGFISLANVLLLMGIATHLGYPMKWRWPLALMGGYLLLLLACLSLPSLWEQREVVLSLHSIAWDAWIIWLLVMHSPKSLRGSSALTAAVFFADLLFYGVRAYVLSGDLLEGLPGVANALISTNYLFGTLALMMLMIGLLTMQAQKMMRELRHAADHDALSGLPNRSMFTRLARRAIVQCEMEGASCVVMLCDLDHFKTVNDKWGHGVGDLALKHFSWVIRDAGLPRTALFSRYGGEEFAVFLPGCEKEEASILAERIRRMVEQTPVVTDDGVIPLTVSIGTVLAQGLSYEEALEAADVALYAAKNSGRNRVVWSDDLESGDAVDRNRAWLQPQLTGG